MLANFAVQVLVYIKPGKIYGVNLRIQSEYRKIRTRKNSVSGHFSRSDIASYIEE